MGPASLLWPGERGSTPGAAENPLPGCRAAPPDQSLPEGERGHRESDTPHASRRAARRLALARAGQRGAGGTEPCA